MARFLTFILLVFLTTSVNGARVEHFIMADDSSLSTGSQRACYDFLTLRNLAFCAPTPHTNRDEPQMRLGVLLKSSPGPIKVATQVLNEDYNESFVDTLFKDRSFQSFSGAAYIRASYRNFGLKYTPSHAIGAYKLTNPALPEINLAVMQQNIIGISHNYLLRPHKSLTAFYSIEVEQLTRRVHELNADALSASVIGIKEQMKKEKVRKPNGHGSLAILNQNSVWTPTLAIRVQNIGEETTCETCDEKFISIEEHWLMKSSGKLLVSRQTSFGAVFVGVNLPFYGFFSELKERNIAVSGAYSIPGLVVAVSYSPLMVSSSFNFRVNYFELGVQYTEEKQDNQFEIERRKHSYVFTNFQI